MVTIVPPELGQDMARVAPLAQRTESFGLEDLLGVVGDVALAALRQQHRVPGDANQ